MMANDDEESIFAPLLTVKTQNAAWLAILKEDFARLLETGETLLMTPQGTRTKYAEEKAAEIKATVTYKSTKTSEPLKEVSNTNSSNKRVTRNASIPNITRAIKKEKIDELVENKENDNAMLPPAKVPAPRGRKKIKTEPDAKPTRSTRSKMRSAAQNESRYTDARASDVILQKDEVPVIDLNSTEESEVDYVPTKKATKGSAQSSDEKKHNLSQSSDDMQPPAEAPASKRTKRKKVEKAPPKEVDDDGSVYEDARSSIESAKSNKSTKSKRGRPRIKKEPVEKETPVEKEKTPEKTSNKEKITKEVASNKTPVTEKQTNEVLMNETVVISKPQILNETVVIEKPKTANINNETMIISKQNDEYMNMDDLLTDDDSPKRPKTSIKKDNEKKPTGKSIFNPYECSPVKMRVEAFERITQQAASTSRTTRSKKRVPTTQTKERALSTQRGTPLKSQIPMSASKIPRGTTPISAKTSSALKASQQEFQNREMRRRELEKQKLQQQEELRKKREEKHLKAQRKREEEEQKKAKLREEQIQKENEKYEQMLAEREEKHRLKQEAEKKKLLAAKERRLEEERKKMKEEKRMEEEEERRRFEERKRKEEMQYRKIPIYMTEPMPLLPTDDCYDSDDKNNRREIRKPEWSSSNNVYKSLKIADSAGHQLKNTFFLTKPTTLILSDIFQCIEAKKLKRTSSAVWHSKPRFTMLAKSEQSFMDN